MDTFRGWPEEAYEPTDFADSAQIPPATEDLGPAPSPVGQDERRMQVRAYNHWASLLADRNFPSIEDLDPANLPDFGPYSVLLDFTSGIEDPAVQFLGASLARECGTNGEIRALSDVPSRSLLSRITDHYMQIIANQAPIGFEAEFVNQRGQTILYRGILLPFSSDDDTIDFIYGVINWKELPDQIDTDELMLEIDQALEAAAGEPVARRDDEMTDWADAPVALHGTPALAGDPLAAAGIDHDADAVLDLGALIAREGPSSVAWPEPAFGVNPPYAEPEDDTFELTELAEAEAEADMGLADWLASAREMALVACSSEDRTRSALYAAIGRAYDFSLAAQAEPEGFHELVADAGLTMQDRAPMTPVVKLVFGADYDKTRLTEFAAALDQAHRVGIARGSLGAFLSAAPGGLKGVVNEERRWRKQASGKSLEPREAPRETLARKLRKLDAVALADLAAEGQEFTLLVARRLPSGEVVVIGEVPEDVGLLERAARKLVA
ncbi:hypothetical protein [Novosphingobium sp. Gsoil 351]|uniref:PAS domain-containing protein n=1 Tax=Novosphingobium sp. Gsoil 351 TaxID=2675225 RepID=UPI0012B47C58|nr:hypothetical protein [Novosphingobium sp. Gsoil 351]QGN55121.1 hypothetical protein GKE62_11715 [Novosphingobium sp. Gsoil 351]